MDSHTKTKKTLQSFFIMLDNDSDSQIKQVKEYFSQRLSQEGIQRVSFFPVLNAPAIRTFFFLYKLLFCRIIFLLA